jgi:DNA (cytosine-5)-methyltransferase 1
MSVKCIDLFSGIGGFHATASSLGWSTIYACDSDERNNAIYERNWKLKPAGDIQVEASESQMLVPKHDVLFAGFPCQPFSKSGAQRGMEESRGTLFWNIARILEVRKPRLVVLENVRNLWGPRHKHEWDVIIQTLRDLGYRVSDEPMLTSPHRIGRRFGGRPQTRERVYINATYVPPKLRSRFPLEAERLTIDDVALGWDPKMDWSVLDELRILAGSNQSRSTSRVVSPEEEFWVDTWDELVGELKSHEIRIPGIPLWADVWTGKLTQHSSMPQWKHDFIFGNQVFYQTAQNIIDAWLRNNPAFMDFPPSRRKLEWQAGENGSLWDCLLQFRPSGIRAKRPNYIPAAVAITQTSVIGPLRRQLSVAELAHMQGLPEWFDFGNQSPTLSYRQLGNGISVASAFHSVLAHLRRDQALIRAMGRRDLLTPIEIELSTPDS